MDEGEKEEKEKEEEEMDRGKKEISPLVWISRSTPVSNRQN